MICKSSTRGMKFPVEILSPEEVKQLMGAFSRRGSAGIRDRALTCLMWRTGLRISEALALLPKDVDHDKGTIRVLHGKGNKARTVGVDPGCLAVLDTWMARRKVLKLTAKQLLFCKLKGGRLNGVAVRASLKRAGARVGIEKRIHPHGLRHAHASELRSEGVEIGVISKQLGHACISTTARYLDHVNPVQVINTIAARTW